MATFTYPPIDWRAQRILDHTLCLGSAPLDLTNVPPEYYWQHGIVMAALCRYRLIAPMIAP